MITTASQLWSYWTSENILRSQDHDRDVADAMRTALGNPSIPYARLPRAMDTAGWSARDLIRAILPVLASFSGMLVDLLALYERVGARTTGKDGLRIHYEFEPGVEWDDRLVPFRETVRRTQTVMSEIEAFEFRSDHAWRDPLQNHTRDLLDSGADTLGINRNSDLRAWPFASEVPTFDVPDPDLRPVAARYRQVIIAALARLSTLGPSYQDVRALRYDEDAPPLDDGDRDLIQSASDFWPVSAIGSLQQLPAIIAGLPEAEARAALREYAAWLDGFWRPELVLLEQQIKDLTDILSLPHWGRRYDLYSAWLTAAMDAALAPDRLAFDVSDGVLAFPFHGALLARILTTRGPVELWTEKRFTASNLIGKGRTKNIQPDYVFIDGATSTVSVVVEAKQYKSPYSKNPGKAAHDYAGNLRSAKVLIVAHGPLRANSIDFVEAADRPRVAFHHDVRPGSPLAIARLRDEIVALLPPPAEALPAPKCAEERGTRGFERLAAAGGVEAGSRTPRPWNRGHVMLQWSRSVKDLDLHLVDTATGERVSYLHTESTYASLGADTYEGGPECAVLHGTDGDVAVEVHLHSHDVTSVQDAAPTVTITTLRGSVTLTPPTDPVGSRVWWAATVHADGTVEPSS